MLGVSLLRTSSQILHSIMGGTAVFCLFYAALVPDPKAVCWLLVEGGKWGIMGWLVLHAQCKYLDR